MDDEDIARVCHEAIRAMQVIADEAWISPPWDDAAEWQRKAALAGVRAGQGAPDPRAAQEAWCSSKRRDGWTYGPVKDPERKTHPCLVPYEELSAAPEAEGLPPAGDRRDPRGRGPLTEPGTGLPIATERSRREHGHPDAELVRLNSRGRARPEPLTLLFLISYRRSGVCRRASRRSLA